MVCYSVPLITAIILFIARRFSGKDSANLRLLNLILAGGAAMLVIDHAWNGELFLIGENIISDLLLGVAMTIAAAAFWVVVVTLAKSRAPAKVIAKG